MPSAKTSKNGSGGSKRSTKSGKSPSKKSSKGTAKRSSASKRTSKDSSNNGDQGRRPYWSGTITFGLVTLPVDVYPATRSTGVSLRMVDDDGTPLRRRYYCPRDEVALDSEDIVRGYPVGDDEFVTVEDDELDALAPERSQAIDLSRFVAADEIDPSYIENVYVLAPGEGALLAYRLLAHAMQDTDRAGMATLVMRGKEYVVALTSARGVLRMATLRFHDELRTPADIGLPDLETASVGDIKSMQAAMERLEKSGIALGELEDKEDKRLLALVDRKVKEGEDVFDVAADVAEQAGSRDDDDAADIMALLRRSLVEAGA